MNKKPIKLEFMVILVLLSCRALFAEIVLDTIAKFTYLSPENNSSGYFRPMTVYTDYQWNTTKTLTIGPLDQFRIDMPLAQDPDFDQVTALVFSGWPVTIDSIVIGADTVTVGYDVYHNPIQVYYHLTDYYGYEFPPPSPRPVDEIKICAMPKTESSVIFFRNILHTDAAPPSFNNQPSSGTHVIGTKYVSFSGSARAYDGGMISYQWYSNTTASNVGGTPIEGEISSHFIFPTDVVGTFYYYIVATNTNEAVSGNKTASVASNVATIIIIDPSVSVLSPNHEIPIMGGEAHEQAAVFPKSVEARLSVGPNPVARVAGKVGIFWHGEVINSGSLSVFDASGNLVAKIKVAGVGEIGSWYLKNLKGTEVSEGTYLLKGTITTKDGGEIKVSQVIGIR
jgi:hypothetical protein